jgi:predicted RNA-binding Zn-ribbon protein involved in translation (DUF1610 family)
VTQRVSKEQNALGEQRVSPATFACPNCGHEPIGEEQFCGRCGGPRARESECQTMQSKSVSLWHMQPASNAPSSAMPPANESSRLDAPTRVNPSEQETSSRRITPSHLAESSAEDQDSLTAAWAAAVRMEASALPAHLSPSRREEEPAPLPAAAEAETVETDADARSSEVKSWLEVLSDSQIVSPFVHLWRARRGEFYLAIALVLMAIVIPWVIWSK